MRDRIFYSICFGFLFGILLRTLIFLDIYFLLFIICFALVFFFYFLLVSENKWILILIVFILSLSLGITRFTVFDNQINDFLGNKLGQKVSLTGVIIEEPDIRQNNQKLSVRLENQRRGARVLLSADLNTEYNYGDEISFSGKLQKPDNFMTDQGKEFDYINYLRKNKILYIISYPSIEIISSHNGSALKYFLFSLKKSFLEKVNLQIPNPESTLLGGLILGERSSFSEELRQNFVNTGTIHIVALSGYNITIVSEWIMKIFSFLPRNIGAYFGILAILLFVLMTGANSTALRAGIMASLMIFARATGRNYDVARTMILAAVLMIFINPFVLVYDVSFQLSFIATIGVIFYAPRFEKYFRWITPKLGLRDIVSVTTAVYIFVLPFILYKMGNLSIVALPANILILPLIPFTMLFGFLSGFLGFFMVCSSSSF